MDGTGIKLSATYYPNPTTFTLINKNGIQFPNNTWSGSTNSWLIENPNGNELTFSQTSSGPVTMTDTLGRTWTTTYGSTNTTNCPVTATSATLWDTPGPSGTTREFKLCYSSHTATTSLPSLSTSGTTRQYSTSLTLMTGVVLPDLTTWRFDYDSYGDISEIYSPTGGTITYSYNLVAPGGTCYSSGGTSYYRAVASRAVSDGTHSNTWSYSTAPDNSYNVVNDPMGNQTKVIPDACGELVSQVLTYSGSSTLLQTVTKTYQGLYDPYAADLHTGNPDVELPQSTTTTWHNGETSEVQHTYDPGFSYTDENFDSYSCGYLSICSSVYGLVMTGTQNDYGSGSPGPALVSNATDYKAFHDSDYLTANLLNLPISEAVLTAPTSGYKCAETDFGYDESAAASSGVSQNHVSVSTVRGNLTSITRQLFTSPCTSASPGASPLPTTNVVYDTGTLHTSEDPLLNVTTYLYSSSYYGTYPTTVTNAKSQSTSYTYDFNTGLVAMMTDPNSQETQYTYDCMLRRATVTYPDTGEDTSTPLYGSSMGCGSGNPFNGMEDTRKINGSLTHTRTTKFDGLGREIQTYSSVPPSTCSSNYAYVDITYDADGRVQSVSTPDCTSTMSDDINTTYQYDALNRVTQVTEQDGSTVATAYADNSSNHTYCTTVTDEASHTRTSCADGAGRMKGVWEAPAARNYETDYGYNPLGNLLQVQQQGGASSSSWRTRTFAYDSLSHLLTAANPESSTISYTYDHNGNVTSKTDARGVTINYSPSGSPIDALNRITEKTYSSGDPAVTYTYDQSACLGASSCFNIGRRTSMTDASGSESWSYDQMGRPIVDQRATNTVSKSTVYGYNYDGTIASLNYPSGRIITYGINVAEQPTSAKDNANSITYADSALYTAFGALSSLTNGSSGTILSTWYYNARMQPCRIAVNSSGSAPGSCVDTNAGNVLDLTYNFNSGSGDNGDVIKLTNSRSGQSGRSVNYLYDTLGRISAAYTDGNLWGESYQIDPWGNLYGIGAYSTKPAGEYLSQSATTNNQLSSPCTGTCYDSAGNMLGDGANTYTYDAEDRISTGAGVTYTYDGDGKRVEKSIGGTAYKLYWYDINGNVLDESDGSGNLTDEYIFFNGKRIARRVVLGQ